MTAKSINRSFADITVAMDSWTEPFWSAAKERRLVVPRCKDCGHVRWPPGPFCPECQGQATEWISPGAGKLYSFTVLPEERKSDGSATGYVVPALVRFADAGGVILLGTLADAPLEEIAVDRDVSVDWSTAQNTNVPVFRLVG